MAGNARASDHPARWWTMRPDGRMECRLCPRFCKLQEGQRGFCFVRQRAGPGMVLATYGRSSGFCIDPIEKKPLNHFLPGTSVLSFGTAGCNLGCRFCQNWEISKARGCDRLSEAASPDRIAATAKRLGCRSVAFTYNDPVVFAEYAIDVAQACREQGITTVAVTAGYLTAEARPEFFRAMDAANVDLKAFTENFYHRLCFAELQPVLDTLRYLRRETNVWFEVTTLLIPGENDTPEELDQASDWFAANLGPEVPWHFTAFHPDFKMLDTSRTPPATLTRARAIARSKGLKHVYTGNVHDREGGSTWCPSCGALLIERDGYELSGYRLDGSRCKACGCVIAGRFEGQPGSWGAHRQPVRLS
jgi:pyruvate formate lyase activating enzyme